MDHGSIFVRRAFLRARGSRRVFCSSCHELNQRAHLARSRHRRLQASHSSIDPGTPTRAEFDIGLKEGPRYKVCILRLGPFGRTMYRHHLLHSTQHRSGQDPEGNLSTQVV